MFEWVKGNAYTMLVTLYPNNFTLNNVAAAYFDDIRWCCIGLDRENRKVAKQNAPFQDFPGFSRFQLFFHPVFQEIFPCENGGDQAQIF